MTLHLAALRRFEGSHKTATISQATSFFGAAIFHLLQNIGAVR
jgi:hypothetical protein